jgi:hypothetical protein
MDSQKHYYTQMTQESVVREELLRKQIESFDVVCAAKTEFYLAGAKDNR